MNSTTFCKLDEESNESLMYDAYPWRMFIKYLEDDDTYKKDNEQFGKYIAIVLNTFKYKYSNTFAYGGALTEEKQVKHVTNYYFKM